MIKARLVRVPWWLRLLFSAACVLVGSLLIAAPFGDLPALRWLVAAALVLTGLCEITEAPATSRPSVTMAIGLAWIGVGIFAAVWPGSTVVSLALLVGLAMIVGGAIKLGSALFGNGPDRGIAGVTAVASILIGILALSWPAVSVLVLSVLFGLRTVLLGIEQLVLAWKSRKPGTATTSPRRWPKPLRWVAAFAVLALAVGGSVISYQFRNAGPSAPGEFYSAPVPLPDKPAGTILRSEIIEPFYDGATSYRVLYLSTGFDDKPAAVSGVIIVPDAPAPAGGNKIVGFTHGTVGVQSNCAPSMQGPRFIPHMEGLPEFINAGYVVASTDYQGLGTAGPHPYIVGKSAGMNELDAVRAAHNLAEAHAGTEFAVWGHSQGGQASLFTGQLAKSYAPELTLVGVAAGAPSSDLAELLRVNIKTPIGKVLVSMTLKSWSEVYPEAKLEQIVSPVAAAAITRIAQSCLYDQKQILAAIPSATLLDLTLFTRDFNDVPSWANIVKENYPGQIPTDVPILIIQGENDPIIAPEITEKVADNLCKNGETVTFRLYPDVAHLDAGIRAAPDVATWITDRFTGQPAASTCKPGTPN